MVEFTQQSRRLQLETPLGPDVLGLARMTGHEEISRPFRFHLELVSPDDAIKAEDLVGQRVTVSMRLFDGSLRHVDGFVSRFGYAGTGKRFTRYTAEVVPWLWFLTRTADCRIFQKMSVPKIVEQVFTELGFHDFEIDGIRGEHPDSDFCVQYRETDFNFVSRLLEQEGIHYHFRHEAGRHVLVLADWNGAFQDCPERDVEYVGPDVSSQHASHIVSWERSYEFVPGKWAQTDYNHEMPATNLLTRAETVLPLADLKKFEVFEYPGEYAKAAEGTAYTRVRMEAEELAFDMVRAASGCRTFTAGGKFVLATHPRAGEAGKPYLITAVDHHCSSGGAWSAEAGESVEHQYQNDFTCIPAATPFRPGRITPKPVVRGAQTAVVTGPAGEEIHTDDQGRVKLHFFWDRLSQRDENSSCWIRVSQVNAGKGFGSMSVPRIGEEVIVEFLEGDPDRPVVTGRLYNAQNTPPYGLPGTAMVAGVKSNSTPGGGGANEFTLDDTQGKEKITVHAQFDMASTVEHDQTDTVNNNRGTTIAVDDTETVHGKQTITVDGDHTTTLKAKQTLTVTADQTNTLNANRTTSITSNDDLTVSGKQTIHVTGAIAITSDAKITLTVGGSTIEITPSSITMSSTEIKLGATKIEAKADAQAVIQSAKVDVKADGMLTCEAGGIAAIKGATVQLN